MQQEEMLLWEELIHHKSRRLDNCLLLISYRTADDEPPQLERIQPIRIKARPFDFDSIMAIIVQSFHLEDSVQQSSREWRILCGFLFDVTKGNPFEMNTALATLVRDSIIVSL